MPKSTHDTLRNWEDLLNAVQETECELGGVAPFREVLAAARNQALVFKALRDSLEISTEDVAHQLREKVAAGDRAFVSLRGYIRSVLGNRRDKLRRYGMKPFPGSRPRSRPAAR
jgi:hypothetical protein